MPKKGLTVKQAKFVKAKAEGKTTTEAAMIAYDVKKETVAASIGSENLRKPNIMNAINYEFERQGITLERIVKPISDALDAQKIVTSPTEPDKEVPDHAIRLKAVGMAAQFMGIRGEEKSSTNIINIVKEQSNQYGI